MIFGYSWLFLLFFVIFCYFYYFGASRVESTWTLGEKRGPEPFHMDSPSATVATLVLLGNDRLKEQIESWYGMVRPDLHQMNCR